MAGGWAYWSDISPGDGGYRIRQIVVGFAPYAIVCPAAAEWLSLNSRTTTSHISIVNIDCTSKSRRAEVDLKACANNIKYR